MTRIHEIVILCALLLCLYCRPAWGWIVAFHRPHSQISKQCLLATKESENFYTNADNNNDNNNNDDGADDEDDNDAWIYDNLEVLTDEDDDDDEEDWIPDSIKARGRKTVKHLRPAKEVIKTLPDDDIKSTGATTERKKGASPYTEEEEELIASMGGKAKGQSRREAGYLGDSTLAEISTDYSVPICYLADVLAMWGVPVPINVHDRLGDLVTGEQAFALVEAVNTLDVGALQDRYSNSNILQLCHDWDMDLKEVFEFAMKEGWNLPFGVRTNLRVEQETELLRVFSLHYYDD